MFKFFARRICWGDILLYVMSVVSIVPIWIPEFLPFVDLPQHAAQIGSLHELVYGSAFHEDELEINWFTPYLGGYVLLYIASLVLPMSWALKLVISISILAIPVVTGWLLGALGGDERLRWLAIPAGYSFAVYWGFLSFVVAIPVGLLLVVITVQYDRKPTSLRAFGIAAYCIGLFFFHVVALGFSALISLTFLIAKNADSLGRAVRLAIPYLAPAPLIGVWMMGMFATERAVRDGPVIWGDVANRMLVLFNQFAGSDGYEFALALIVVIMVLLLPYLSGYRPSRKPERWLPFVVGVATYIAFPSYAMGTAFLFHRLAVFLVPLWLIIWDPPERVRPVFAVLVLGTLGIWMASNSLRFLEFSRSNDSFARVLREAEPARRMAGLMICNSDANFINPVYLHFASWYQAQLRGISDMSFATTHPSVIRYRDMGVPRMRGSASGNPLTMDWERDGGARYDYFLVCAPTNMSHEIFGDHVDQVKIVASEPPWWLYEREHGMVPSKKGAR